MFFIPFILTYNYRKIATWEFSHKSLLPVYDS
jgi:hypothetical protein